MCTRDDAAIIEKKVTHLVVQKTSTKIVEITDSIKRERTLLVNLDQLTYVIVQSDDQEDRDVHSTV